MEVGGMSQAGERSISEMTNEAPRFAWEEDAAVVDLGLQEFVRIGRGFQSLVRYICERASGQPALALVTKTEGLCAQARQQGISR
jgi:hypothetical protein